MAWIETSLSADEIAWAAADKPMISSNALYSEITMLWAVGTTVATANWTPDDADDDFPSINLFDARPGLISRANAADTQFTIVVDASADPLEFDWLGILNHNLDTAACTTFTVQISDSNDFTTRLTTIQTNTIGSALSSDKRYANLVMADLEAVSRFSGVEYVRFQIVTSSIIPYIGELILGRRYQQPYQPDVPFASLNQSGFVGSHESQSGVISSVVGSSGQRLLNATFHHNTQALQDEVFDFWDDLGAGEQPFFYHDEPNSNPMDFYMMHIDDPVLDNPYGENNVRDWMIEATEVGPEFLTQDP